MYTPWFTKKGSYSLFGTDSSADLIIHTPHFSKNQEFFKISIISNRKVMKNISYSPLILIFFS